MPRYVDIEILYLLASNIIKFVSNKVKVYRVINIYKDLLLNALIDY